MEKQYSQKNSVMNFKRWSRQSYSIFASLGKIIRIATLSIACVISLLSNSVKAQKQDSVAMNMEQINENEPDTTISLDACVVIATNVFNAAEIYTLSSQSIKSSPAKGLPELLESVPGLDVRQRGAFSVQSDLHIRGGSFDQAVVLLNGVNFTDPQTGHFNLNLPIPNSSIQKVQVLNPALLSTFANTSFNGGVNINTLTSDTNYFNAKILAGDYGLFSFNTNIIRTKGNLMNHFATSFDKSDGYIENTDFSNFSLFYRGEYNDDDRLLIDWQAAYNEKEYGANSFYTPKYPNQYEEVSSFLASAKIAYKFTKETSASITSYYKTNKDKFMLFRDNPASWYTGHNYHKSEVFGAKAFIANKNKFGITKLIGELREERINSSVLGYSTGDSIAVPNQENAYYTNFYKRYNNSICLNHYYFHNRIIANISLLANIDSNIALYPAVLVSYLKNTKNRFSFTFNIGMRKASFTELFYKSSTHISNDKLEDEKSYNFDLSYKYENKAILATAAIFYRRSENLIDWVKEKESDKWQSTNYTTINSVGTEMFLKLDLAKHYHFKRIFNVSLAYSYIYNDKQSGLLSAYAMDYLKNKIDFNLNTTIYKNLSCSINMSFQDRSGSYSAYEETVYIEEREYDDIFLINTRLSYSFNNIKIFADVANILDNKYYDIGNVIQSGRWFSAGIIIN